MKQYKKGRPNPIQLYYCNGKRCGGMCSSLITECKLTTEKRFARKDRFGKPIKESRFIQSGKGGA